MDRSALRRLGIVVAGLVIGLAGTLTAASAVTPDSIGATQVTPNSVAPVPRPNIVNAMMRNATSEKYRADISAYSARHYGVSTSVLKPEAIVLHYTVSGAGSWRGIIAGWDVSQANGSNTGGENPQPAAHFIIEQDGTIFQTMPTDLIVRHAYGVNHKAIGIEFIEQSSANNVLARDRQREAGLALVRWLMSDFRIPHGNIMGHGTVNSHPLFFDLTGLKNDHTDWNASQVAAFRERIGYVPFRPYEVYGEIGRLYSNPAVAAALGEPRSDEVDGPLPGSRMNTFQRGAIYWSPATGAHEAYGDIYRRYASLSATNLAGIGLPTSGETNGPLPGSRMNTFQRGGIYWSATTGAHDVYGEIYRRYTTLSPANLAGIGLPTTGEQPGPLSGSRMNGFQRGGIYWSATTGAHDVYGDIAGRYMTLSPTNVAGIGLPTSGETNGPLPGSRMNTFQRGGIYWSATTGAHDVYGAIHSYYTNLPNATRTALGLPTTGEQPSPTGRMNTFQRGTINWNQTTGHTTHTLN